VVQEQLEEQELGARQLDQPPAAAYLVGHRVELEVAEAQHVALLPARAAQQRLEPREQLLERERLGQVVVGARLQPRDAVVDGIARGEHQHRRAVAGVAHPPADLEPVEAGHQHVEQHGVGGRRGLVAHRLAPVARERDVEPFESQDALECLADRRLVVDHQHAHCRGMVADEPERQVRRRASARHPAGSLDRRV
jgi:hypothetical protein